MSDKFNGQRHKSMSEAFERMYGPSMGAKVDAPACSECGSSMEKVGEIPMGLDPAHFVPSFVPAPRCSECETEMAPASSTEWRCENSGCPAYGKPLHLGVYPVQQVRPKNTP